MGWKVLAVFVGLVTDIGISLVLGLGLGLALSFYLLTHGVAMHDLVPKVTTLTQTTPLLLAGAGLGSFGSLIGGFVTGWIAGSQRVVCGAIMAVCSVLAGIPFWYADPLWYDLVGMVVTLIIATAGAWLAEAFFGSQAHQAATP